MAYPRGRAMTTVDRVVKDVELGVIREHRAQRLPDRRVRLERLTAKDEDHIRIAGDRPADDGRRVPAAPVWSVAATTPRVRARVVPVGKGARRGEHWSTTPRVRARVVPVEIAQDVIVRV